MIFTLSNPLLTSNKLNLTGKILKQLPPSIGASSVEMSSDVVPPIGLVVLIAPVGQVPSASLLHPITAPVAMSICCIKRTPSLLMFGTIVFQLPIVES